MLFLFRFCFYVIPLVFISYTIFSLVTADRPPKWFYLKLALYLFPSLAVIHFAFTVNEADKVIRAQQTHLRSGLYINQQLGDTVKLDDEFIFMLHAYKAKPPSQSIADTTLQLSADDDLSVKKKPHKVVVKPHAEPQVDIKSAYQLSRDTIDMFCKNWDSKLFVDNVKHFIKKTPVSGDVTDAIRVDSHDDKKYLYYQFSLHNDTLTLNNGKDKTKLIQYIKQNTAVNGKSAATK